MKNPLPGMNPWLEDYWRDVHAKLLVYASDAINDALPPGLRARVDERLAVENEEEGEPNRDYLPDVAITEDWDQPAYPATVFASGGAATLEAARPVIVTLGDRVLRHVEIVNSDEHVVTALEVLSPSNQRGSRAVRDWRRKRFDYLRGGISLVEVDLLRGGEWVLPSRDLLRPVPLDSVAYHVCVTRQPRVQQHEFYVMPLRERLPIIRVPLRRGDPDIALDLQALINQCYERGHYGKVLRYDRPLHPALPEPEAAWVRELLAARPSG